MELHSVSYGRNRQGKVFLVRHESVFRLLTASANYDFQRTALFLEVQGRVRLGTAIIGETRALLSLRNYSQLQLRTTQRRIIAAQLLGAFNAWL